ncbi:unnamed protein product [Blumeria hordei]|uniref:Chromo domain-containing protein n=1 Tax=Blumeria hordei TaxID=2867405 RepID=A0A383UJ13_BLUHO|nr:unnamed protein product [Blumeria hordei]
MGIAHHPKSITLKSPAPKRLKIQFDFIVAEHSAYRSGSTPSAPDPTLVTDVDDNDRDGYIISELKNDKCSSSNKYIVAWKDKPHLLVCVDDQNARDYVSSKSIEEWHLDKFDSELKAMTSSHKPSREDAKTRRKRKPLSKKRKRCKPIPLLPTCNSDPQSSNMTSTGPEIDCQDLTISPSSPSKLLRSPNVRHNKLRVKEIGDEHASQFQSASYISRNGDQQCSEKKFTAPISGLQTRAKLYSPNENPPSTPTDIEQSQILLSKLTEASSELLKDDLIRNTKKLDPASLSSSQKSMVDFMPHFTSELMAYNESMRKKERFKGLNQSSINGIYASEPSTGAFLQHSNSFTLDTANQTECEIQSIPDESWGREKQGSLVTNYLFGWKGDDKYTWESEGKINTDIVAEYVSNKKAHAAKLHYFSYNSFEKL